MKAEGETVVSTEMNKRTETVNGSIGEENRGSDEPASVGGSSGENTGSDEPGNVDDGSGENDKETSKKEEGNTPSVHQQYPKTTEGCTHEVSLKLTVVVVYWCHYLFQPHTHTHAQPINLDSYSSAEELESAGLERLKVALQVLGLKCGGTLQERAQRLFSTKGKTIEEFDPSLFAKAGKQRRRKK